MSDFDFGNSKEVISFDDEWTYINVVDAILYYGNWKNSYLLISLRTHDVRKGHFNPFDVRKKVLMHLTG